jgi:hypothetical protein
MNPIPLPVDNIAPDKELSPPVHTTSGRGNGPDGKKKIGVEREIDG